MKRYLNAAPPPKFLIQISTHRNESEHVGRSVHATHALEDDALRHLDEIKQEVIAAGYTVTDQTDKSFDQIVSGYGWNRYSVQKNYLNVLD